MARDLPPLIESFAQPILNHTQQNVYDIQSAMNTIAQHISVTNTNIGLLQNAFYQIAQQFRSLHEFCSVVRERLDYQEKIVVAARATGLEEPLLAYYALAQCENSDTENVQ